MNIVMKGIGANVDPERNCLCIRLTAIIDLELDSPKLEKLAPDEYILDKLNIKDEIILAHVNSKISKFLKNELNSKKVLVELQEEFPERFL
jgi:hypothetical protein